MNPEENKPNPNVETYATHMADVIEGGEGGTEIKKIIAEERLYQEAKQETVTREIINKAYLYGGFLFLGLAIILISYQMAIDDNSPAMEVKPEFQPLIFTDETSFVEIGGKEREQIADLVVLEAQEGDLKAGGVEGIYLMDAGQIVGFSKFLEITEASIVGDPDYFGENFMIGTVAGGERELFLLLPVRSFSDAFNKMREWEEKMFFDLHGFFDIAINSSNARLLTQDFHDAIVENKNARMLSDANGTELMYVFADENFVVISNSHSAVREVILRLSGSKIKK